MERRTGNGIAGIVVPLRLVRFSNPDRFVSSENSDRLTNRAHAELGPEIFDIAGNRSRTDAGDLHYVGLGLALGRPSEAFVFSRRQFNPFNQPDRFPHSAQMAVKMRRDKQ